jgi:cell fate regulator YaaT (PSP1 superfamily)
MSVSEYLVAYGQTGEFGRFRSAVPLTCQRGDRVVVRTHRGVESGQILRAAEAGHARFLPNTTLGQLLRPFGADDVRTEAQLRDRRSEVWGRASQLAEDLGLPLQVLDAEILLDGEHVVLHHLRGADCDVRPFVSTLAREFDLHVLLVDLTRSGESAPHADEEEHAEHGCGSGGGCGSCGSGGGCGSCSASAATVVPAPPDAAYFAGLREQMERQRTPLL